MRSQDRPETAVSDDFLHFPDTADGPAGAGGTAAGPHTGRGERRRTMTKRSLTMSQCLMLKKISALCAGALLLACAGIERHPQRAAAFDADQVYDGGRQHHLAGRYGEAI